MTIESNAITHNRVHEVPDNTLDAIDYCYKMGWTDGLPVVPPEKSRVEQMLAMEGRPAETILALHPATGNELTIHGAAVNAVMAGCLPEFFPVITAAFEAMNESAFNFHGSTASTGGSAPLLIVSGPIVDDIGMNANVNLFGPGNRANATIGRAVRLIIMNIFQMKPGVSDKSTQGNPGKYTNCIAERSNKNPWSPLNVELGYPAEVSSVTAFAGGGFFNIENHGGNTPEALLTTIADVMSNLGSISLGQSVVVLSPEHVAIIAGSGWSKSDVQHFLFEHAFQTASTLRSIGKLREKDVETQGRENFHRGMSANDILITVGGGDAGGHSAFIPSWSRGRLSLMQSRPIGVCLDC